MAQEVTSRLGRNPFSDAADRSFEVVASRAEGRWLVQIHVRDSDGNSQGSRTLDSFSEDCSAVFSATVLALALTVDPESQRQAPAIARAAPSGVVENPPIPPAPGSSTAALAPNSTPQARPGSDRSFQQSEATTVAQPVPAAPSPSVAVPTQPAPAPQFTSPKAPAAAPPWVTQPQESSPPPGYTLASDQFFHASIEAGPVLGLRLLPRAAPGVTLRGRAITESGWGVDVGALLLGPARTSTENEGADIGVGLSTGYLGANYALTQDKLALILAGGGSLGVQQVAVYSPVPLDDGPGNYFWAAARAGAALNLTITGPLGIGLGAETLIAITRHEYRLEGGQVIFSTPSVGFWGYFALRLASN